GRPHRAEIPDEGRRPRRLNRGRFDTCENSSGYPDGPVGRRLPGLRIRAAQRVWNAGTSGRPQAPRPDPASPPFLCPGPRSRLLVHGRYADPSAYFLTASFISRPSTFRRGDNCLLTRLGTRVDSPIPCL